VFAMLAVLLWWLRSGAEDDPVASPGPSTQVGPRSTTTMDDAPAVRARAPGVTAPDDPTVAFRPGAATLGGAAVDSGLERTGDAAQEGEAAVEAWFARNAALAEKTVDRYCEASQRLAKTPGLEPPTRERDASSFLTGRADWEDGHTGLLHLPASLTDRMNQPPGAWMRFGLSDYAGLDFAWMRELLTFDHWTLMSAGPLRDGRDLPAFEQIIPNFVTMMQWAKLRLVKGFHERELARASLEVRHLATICASTSTLVGEMVRLSILTSEREFFEAQGLPPLDGALTPQTKQQARSEGFAARHFLMTGVSVAVKKKALACSRTRCAALTEAASLLSGLRGAVPRVREDLEWLKEQQPCEPALLERVATSPPLSSLPPVASMEREFEQHIREMVDGGSF